MGGVKLERSNTVFHRGNEKIKETFGEKKIEICIVKLCECGFRMFPAACLMRVCEALPV